MLLSSMQVIWEMCISMIILCNFVILLMLKIFKNNNSLHKCSLLYQFIKYLRAKSFARRMLLILKCILEDICIKISDWLKTSGGHSIVLQYIVFYTIIIFLINLVHSRIATIQILRIYYHLSQKALVILKSQYNTALTNANLIK